MFGAVGGVEDGVVVVVVGEAAEGVVTGGVVAGTAGVFAVGVLFAGAFGAAVEVKPDNGIALVDEGFWEMECVEAVCLGSIVELPEDRGDLVVRGVLIGDEGEGVVGLVEEFEG